MNIPKEIALKGSEATLEYIKYVEKLDEIESKRNALVKDITSTHDEITRLLSGKNDGLNLRMLGLNYFGVKKERLHTHALELQSLSEQYLKLTLEFSALETELMQLHEDSCEKGLLEGLDRNRYVKCSFS